jgi:cyclopropane fatty-acyl-phospholipid synthase-like methyltransferase
MINYDIFAKFFDAAMGDRTETAKLLRGFIQDASPKAKKILELACGTGAVLKHLAKYYEVYGIDLSKGMLNIAQREVPEAKLARQNIEDFEMEEKFDAILCIFDSINHVTNFENWKKIFIKVRHHLTDHGVFVFDINTQKRLSRLASLPATAQKFGQNFLVIEVTDAGDCISNWNVKIFEYLDNHQYALHEENIKEISFPSNQIKSMLKTIFRSIKVIDIERKRPSKQSERLYFICRK